MSDRYAVQAIDSGSDSEVLLYDIERSEGRDAERMDEDERGLMGSQRGI